MRVKVAAVLGLFLFAFCFFTAQAENDKQIHNRRPLPREIEDLPFSKAMSYFYTFVQDNIPEPSKAQLTGTFEDLGCDEQCLELIQFLEDPVKQVLAAQMKPRRKVDDDEEEQRRQAIERGITLTNISEAPEPEYWNGEVFKGWTLMLVMDRPILQVTPNTTIAYVLNTTYNETTGQYQTENVTTFIVGPPKLENVSDTAVAFNNEDGLFLSNQVKPDSIALMLTILNVIDLGIPVVYLACEAPPFPINVIGCIAWFLLNGLRTSAWILTDVYDGWNGNARDSWISIIKDYGDILHGATLCNPANRTDLPFQGCNGVDDNCNLEIDECDEDNTPPTVRIDQAALNANGYYSSASAAVAAVSAAVSAVDDCNRIDFTAPSLSGSCGSTIATLYASDECGNSAPINIPIGLDITPPTVTCGASNSFFQSTAAMVDVGFTWSASDDCAMAKFEVMVMMDEATLGNGPDVLVQTDFLSGEVTGVQVKAEANPNLDGRVYTIYAKATDKAGNEQTCTSIVQIASASDPTSAFNNGPYYQPMM